VSNTPDKFCEKVEYSGREAAERGKLVGRELYAQDCTSFEADDEIVRRDDLK